MIQMLVTNPRQQDSVLNLGSDWNQIFDYSNEHKMLYSLEIIEAILVRDQPTKTTEEWLKKFVELNGFEELQSMLINALKDVHKSIKSKKYVDQLFKIIRLLVIGSQLEQSVPLSSSDEKVAEEDDSLYTTPKK